LIKSLAGEHTIILSTHILPEVSMTCSRVAIINRGQVVAMNTPDQLMAQLTGGAGYELEVEGDPLLIQQQLQQLPPINAVEVIADEALPGTHRRYRLTLDAELQAGHHVGRDIAAAIVSAGWGLHEMRRVQVSLEEVFLELTTEETISEEALGEAAAQSESNSATGTAI
jgi:ABC-2 type transport system ATP-binding protein